MTKLSLPNYENRAANSNCWYIMSVDSMGSDWSSDPISKIPPCWGQHLTNQNSKKSQK